MEPDSTALVLAIVGQGDACVWVGLDHAWSPDCPGAGRGTLAAAGVAAAGQKVTRPPSPIVPMTGTMPGGGGGRLSLAWAGAADMAAI